MTENMINNEILSSRQKLLFERLESFVIEFFNYNHLSTISILEINNYFTNIVCPASNDTDMILKSLKKLSDPYGSPSLINSLSVCYDYSLQLDLPKTSVDIAVIYSNSNSYDRMNINEILDNFIDNRITINVLSNEPPFDLLKVFSFINKCRQ